jgi:hypothetical protein
MALHGQRGLRDFFEKPVFSRGGQARPDRSQRGAATQETSPVHRCPLDKIEIRDIIQM